MQFYSRIKKHQIGKVFKFYITNGRKNINHFSRIRSNRKRRQLQIPENQISADIPLDAVFNEHIIEDIIDNFDIPVDQSAVSTQAEEKLNEEIKESDRGQLNITHITQ